MAERTRILFNWKPRGYGHDLADRFRRRLARDGWYVHPSCVEVRQPWPELKAFNPQLFDWHHDQGAPRLGFLVWSNKNPTEVRFADGTNLQSKDGDVIYIVNDEVEHRAPDNQEDRWFVRTGMAVCLNDAAAVGLIESVVQPRTAGGEVETEGSEVMRNLTVEDCLVELRKIVGPFPQIIVDIRDCGQETRGSHGRVEYSAQIGMNGEQYTGRTMAAVLSQVRKALK